MKITWLGQAGLLFETEKLTIMIDPYLSNSVEKINPMFAVPIHCGMFDEVDMSLFELENKIIPQIYKEIELLW